MSILETDLNDYKLVCRLEGRVLQQATLRLVTGRIWPPGQGMDSPGFY